MLERVGLAQVLRPLEGKAAVRRSDHLPRIRMLHAAARVTVDGERLVLIRVPRSLGATNRRRVAAPNPMAAAKAAATGIGLRRAMVQAMDAARVQAMAAVPVQAMEAVRVRN
jgi:hypothetical protein